MVGVHENECMGLGRGKARVRVRVRIRVRIRVRAWHQATVPCMQTRECPY